MRRFNNSRSLMMRLYGSVKSESMYKARKRYAGNIVRIANRPRRVFKK